MKVYREIEQTIKQLSLENIAEERKARLRNLVNYVQAKRDEGQAIRLNFICTHNSRRSHLAQIWAQLMAYYFKIDKVFCYSAGTEATALFPAVIRSLKESGFKIDRLSTNHNPVYSIKYASNEPPVIGFSKTLHHDFNPESAFAAVMTCSQADADCPFVAGAEIRIALPFEDPKRFDDTPKQAEKYAERSLQIASELFYVFMQIKK